MLIQSKRFSLNDSIYCQVIALSLTLKKFRRCPGISFNLLLITFDKIDSAQLNGIECHISLRQVLTQIQKLLESESEISDISFVFKTTRVLKRLHTTTLIPVARSFLNPSMARVYLINKRGFNMKTYDATETYTKQYPVVLDLASEKEFKEYLLENGIEVTPGQLRQYRHRDRKFVYIKLGNHVLYPKHINEHLLEQINE